MKNLSTKKKWLSGNIQFQADPSPIPLINSETQRKKTEIDCNKVKLRKKPASSMSGPYEYKVALFENGEPEEFLLFIREFRKTLRANGVMPEIGRIQYLCTLLCGESLFEFETLSESVGSTTKRHLKQIIISLGTYLPPINAFQNKSV